MNSEDVNKEIIRNINIDKVKRAKIDNMRVNFAKAHKRLWNWLAENPGRLKTHWPEWWHNGGMIPDVEELCFACEASDILGLVCGCCPIGQCTVAYVGWKHSVGINNRLRITSTAKALSEMEWKGQRVFTYNDETEEWEA